MQIRAEQQLNPIADEVSAITAVVRPILMGILYSLKSDVVEHEGGYDRIPLFMLPRLRRPGDGDTGVCFEYAAHDAIRRGEGTVVGRVADALKLCKVPGADPASILFGAEKSGSQALIDTAADSLTNDSRLLSGTRGQPAKLKKHLFAAAAAFRTQGRVSALPQSISGLWKADLFIGNSDEDYWVATTVKVNSAGLKGARGLRIGLVPASEGGSDAIRLDERRNLVVCPLPYDRAFVETFYMAWEVVVAFLDADAKLPQPVALPRGAARTVARYLADRRDYSVLEVVEALNSLAQPELLSTETSLAGVVITGGSSESVDTISAVLAPEPKLLLA